MSCNGCRVLRKGCSDGCLLRPCLAAVEGADAQGHATLFLAKFFGRAGLMGFISNVSESQRPALFQSLLYEACGRTINPVYGSAGLLWSGSWHLCEAAVDAVLRGVNLQPVPPALLSVQTPATSPPPSAPASSPPPEVAFHAPPSQPSRQQSSDMKSRQGHANNAAAMPSFPFHMMDPTAMAYWPLAMAPMMGAHMAAMGSAGYQPAYPTGAPQYAPNDANMPAKPQHQLHQQHQQHQQQQQIQQVQQQQQQQEGNHMWMPPDVSKGQGGQQSTGQGGQHMYEHHAPQSGICSPSGGTSSEACSPMHLAAAPLVAPVARRLTPQSGPFMLSVNTGNGHGVSMVGSEGEPSPIQQLDGP